MAEGVGKAAFKEKRKFSPFLVRKAGIPAVGLWVFEVNLVVGNIEVTAEDDGLGLVYNR